MYVQNQYDYVASYNALQQAVLQHKSYIDQVIDKYNNYGSGLAPQQLSEMVNGMSNSNNYLQSQLGAIDQVMKYASIVGDNNIMFAANSLRSTILGLDTVVKNFTAHIYQGVVNTQYYNQYQQPMIQQNYMQQNMNQQFLPQVNNYNGFGEARSDRDKLMISDRTNPVGWNATNISSGSDLDAYDNNSPTHREEPKSKVVEPVKPNNFQQEGFKNAPEGFRNEFDYFGGNDELDMLLKQYGIDNSYMDTDKLPDKNPNSNLTVPSHLETLEAKDKEIEELKAEINKLKEENKMEKGINKDNVVDTSFNEFLLDQDNKAMAATYGPNGLRYMVKVGDLPSPVVRDIETCDYIIPDKTADVATVSFNNLVESSLRRTMLAEKLAGETEGDKILICSDFMSSIVTLVGDKLYSDQEEMEILAKDFIERFKDFQTKLTRCYTLLEIYDAIEELDDFEFGEKVSEYLKSVLKDEVNDFLRYSIESVAGNIIKGDMDRETAEVIDAMSNDEPIIPGLIDTPAARAIYSSFVDNLRDLFQNYFDIIDISGDELIGTDDYIVPKNGETRVLKEKSVRVFLKVKTRTFGIRFDESLGKLTNDKQVQGVVTMESNPELHNILDHCVTDDNYKRSTECNLDYVPGNNHLMICGKPGINVSYRIYPRYDAKGDKVIRKGFFIKMMSSY